MPIKGISSDRIDERADAFFERAKVLCASKGFSHLTFIASLQSFKVVAEAYFFLSEAYKEERIPPTSKTMLAKVAAMTALAVGIVKPLRAPNPSEVDDEEYEYVNGILALRLSTPLVKHNFEKRPFDDKRRWYKMVQGVDFPSLHQVMQEANASGELSTTFLPALSEAEICSIDSFVESFGLMALLGDHDASFR